MSKLGVFTGTELKQLKPKHRATLRKHILRHLRTSPEIHKIIVDEVGKGHRKLRQHARTRLHSTFRRLKSQSK